MAELLRHLLAALLDALAFVPSGPDAQARRSRGRLAGATFASPPAAEPFAALLPADVSPTPPADDVTRRRRSAPLPPPFALAARAVGP